jgi:hypothetical protein
MSEGYYLYGIIGTDEAKNFGTMGIGGRKDMVSTISYEDVSAIVSRTPVIRYDLSRENLLAHQRVIEEVMKEFTVLPVRFCTIAESAEDIRGVLRKRHSEFKGLLRDMDNKVELGVKVLWRDIKAVFSEIGEEGNIKKLKEKIGLMPLDRSQSERIALGKMVQKALEVKKEREAEGILDILRPLAVETKLNKVHGDSMVLNAAFLVDGGRVRDFDGKISELSAMKNGRMIFKYVGPVPPFNFVNIVVEWR